MQFILGKYKLVRNSGEGAGNDSAAVALWLASGLILWQVFELLSLHFISDVILSKWISAAIVAVVALTGIVMWVWKMIKYKVFDMALLFFTVLAVIAVFSDIGYIHRMSALLDGIG